MALQTRHTTSPLLGLRLRLNYRHVDGEYGREYAWISADLDIESALTFLRVTCRAPISHPRSEVSHFRAVQLEIS